MGELSKVNYPDSDRVRLIIWVCSLITSVAHITSSGVTPTPDVAMPL